MKATLTFSLPEEQEQFDATLDAVKGGDLGPSLWDELFRPAFKHGYSGLHAAELNRLLGNESAVNLISMLSERFTAFMQERR